MKKCFPCTDLEPATSALPIQPVLRTLSSDDGPLTTFGYKYSCDCCVPLLPPALPAAAASGCKAGDDVRDWGEDEVGVDCDTSSCH